MIMRIKFTLFLSLVSLGLLAQTPLKIVEPSDLATDVNNTTLTVNGSSTDSDMEAIVWVVNNGSSSLDLKCKKSEIDVLAGTENTTCWKLCPTTYDVAGSKPVVLVNISGTQMVETAAVGDTVKSFVGHYKPMNLDGCSLFKYEWYDSNDMNTALATIYVRFVHTTGQCTAAIEEIPKIDVSIYPVPANDELKISTSELPGGNLQVEFYDILGKKVNSKNISLQSTNIDVSYMNEGVYFAKFIHKGQVVKTKKFVIKR